MRRLLAIDPGQATGWSAWYVPADGPMLRYDFGLIRGGIAGFKRWWIDQGAAEVDAPNDIVVCEKFEQDGRTRYPDLEPVKIEGLLYGACHRVIWQRNDTKVQVPDDLLKQHALWVTGKEVDWTDGDDVNDSQRHALAWGKFDHLPTLEGYWPE